MSREFIVALEEGQRAIKVEPFIFDIGAQILYCPWCYEGMPVRVMRESVFDFFASMNGHIKVKHSDKNKGVPLGILLGEPIP